MSHPFGDLVSQHLHRKHGLSQSKLAAGILQPPSVITAMCKGKRLTGPRARERVVAVVGWLHQQGALTTLDEANTLLYAAGMASLNGNIAVEIMLGKSLRPSSGSPPLPTSEARTARNHNLPAPSNAIIGRDEDTVAASRLLKRDDVRLITFVGPPGVGKTRLAIEVAHAASGGFVDGAWLVPLAPVTDPDLLASTIAQALNIRLAVGLPPVESVKRFMADKHMLLVLDNLEQILDVATTIAEVLAVAPDVKVIATSRAALRLSAEHLFDVLPLPLSSAVALFVARAQAAQPRFALTDELESHTVVAAICERVDRLPLAIELAAARVRQFTPQTLKESLEQSSLRVLTSGPRDLPVRQQTLRATIEWSYQLLAEDEQRLLRQLGIFLGGAELEQIACVGNWQSEMRDSDVGDALMSNLQSLADKSLVRAETQPDETTRYTLFELIREYALAKLAKHDELDEMRRRHAEAFARLAEQSAQPIRSSDQPMWLARLEREQANMRAALAWSFGASGDRCLGCRLVGALRPFWQIASGHRVKAQRWIAIALQALSSDIPLKTRAGVWMAAAMLDAVPRAEAQQCCRQALTCYREIEDKAGAALASCRLGWTLHQCGHVDDPDTVRFMEEGIALAREVGDDWVTALGLSYLADYATMVAPRDFDRAETLAQEALALFRVAGDWSRVADVLNLLSIISQFRLHFQVAVKYAEQALDVARTTGDALTEMNARWRIAQNMRYLGNVSDAVVLLEDCLQFTRERLTDLDVLWPLGILSMAVNATGDHTRAQALLVEMVCIIRSSVGLTSWRYGLVDCFAAVASARGDALRAARLWGTGDAGWEDNRNPNHVWDYTPLVERTRAALGDDAFEAAHAEGRAMSLEQAIEYALASRPDE